MIVVDTGVLYALADSSDTHHHACTGWLRTVPGSLVIPSLVISEAAYLIGSRGGPRAEALFVEALLPGGGFALPSLRSRRTFRASRRWFARTPTSRSALSTRLWSPSPSASARTRSPPPTVEICPSFGPTTYRLSPSSPTWAGAKQSARVLDRLSHLEEPHTDETRFFRSYRTSRRHRAGSTSHRPGPRPPVGHPRLTV